MPLGGERRRRQERQRHGWRYAATSHVLPTSPTQPPQHWPYALDPACNTVPPPFAQREGYSPAAYLAIWRALEALVDEGLLRSLGCSNMTAAKLHRLWADARHKPVCVQVELHPYLPQVALKTYCDARGVVMVGYHPLGSPSRPEQ